MASLENRNGSYRVVFRYAGRKFSLSLDTNRVVEARASIARLEDNLRRLELGLITLPVGVDLSAFLLSDGRSTAKHSLSTIRTLDELFASYFASIPSGSLEANTLYTMRIHAKHVKQILGGKALIDTLNSASLQAYIGRRGRRKSRNGRKANSTTIRKELATLRTVWNWAMLMGHIETLFPERGLKFPKLEAKSPFRTLGEIEKWLSRGVVMENRLWESAFLSLPEIDVLLSLVFQTAREPYLYPMFMLAAHTGARRCEMLRSEIDEFIPPLLTFIFSLHMQHDTHGRR